MSQEIQVHDSARKHGLDAQEIISLWADAFERYVLEDDLPGRELRVAMMPNGRLIELVGIIFDDNQRTLIIRAMKLRKSTIARIEDVK